MILGLLAAASVSAVDVQARDLKPPVWISRLSEEDILNAWPAAARAARVTGKVKLECLITAKGAVEDCRVVSEDPPGQGFGAAALGLTPLFVFTPAIRAGAPVAAQGVLPIDFRSAEPGGLPDPPGFVRPELAKGPKPEAIKAVWPAEALSAHVDGKASLDCLINVRGLAEDCQVAAESPAGREFGAAALKLTSSFQYHPARGKDGPTPYRMYVSVVFSQTDRPADWYKRPTPEQLRAAWPTKAYRAGMSGKVELDCQVNTHGLLEDCHVLSETPPGQNFGTAAMLLTPQFLLTPAVVDGEPAPSRVRMPITFEYQGTPGRDEMPLGGAILVSHPVWTAAASFADLGAAYPKSGGGAPGYVAFRCELKKTGDLRNCDVTREEPTGKGFESAARKLVHLFRADVTPQMMALRDTMEVNLPIRLIDPASPDFVDRRMGVPMWTMQLDPNRVQRLFPAAAVARGVKTGRGVADCRVTPQGALTDCTPLPATPDGLGFSEAAVQVAQVMKLNPWTDAGGPVDGVRLRLPIRFKLADEPDAADANVPAVPPGSPTKP